MDDFDGRVELDDRGIACLAGTSILVAVVNRDLAAGLSPADVLARYPALVPADISVVLAYAQDHWAELTIDALELEPAP